MGDHGEPREGAATILIVAGRWEAGGFLEEKWGGTATTGRYWDWLFGGGEWR